MRYLAVMDDYEDLPALGLAFALPALVEAMSEEERAARVHVEGDRCELDGEQFFVRARIQLPLVEAGEVFEWTVWVTLGGAPYVRICEALDGATDEMPKPAPALLATRLPLYPDTLDLRCRVHAQERALPLCVVESAAHPLAFDQHMGITIDRVREFIDVLRHGHAH